MDVSPSAGLATSPRISGLACKRASVSPVTPRREVVHADALVWLAETAAPPGASVVTSLPDASEVPVALLPDEVLNFVMPSRFCLPDELGHEAGNALVD